jgi:hypothetical protein
LEAALTDAKSIIIQKRAFHIDGLRIFLNER